jgi:hypothetical protein
VACIGWTMNSAKLLRACRTMDAMVQWVLQGAATVNQMQTLLLAMEGCVLCIVAFGYMWHLSMTVASQRYTIYSVFLAVPSSGCLAGLSGSIISCPPA